MSRQANPAYTDIMDQVASDPTVALRNLDFRNRFLIIKDKKVLLTADNPTRVITWYKKLDLKVNYDGSSNTIADVSNHPLFLIAMSNQTAGNVPTFESFQRIRYIDN